jgi:hypothetical protein
MRYPGTGPVRILWADHAGRERISHAKLVDVSSQGIRLLVDHRIPIGAYVLCNEPKLRIGGRGTVRYCLLNKAQFQIGVEFSGGTGWTPPVQRGVSQHLSEPEFRSRPCGEPARI